MLIAYFIHKLKRRIAQRFFYWTSGKKFRNKTKKS